MDVTLYRIIHRNHPKAVEIRRRFHDVTYKNISHYDLGKFSFSNRIVNIWNSLPNDVVDVDSVDSFKWAYRLHNFWMFQDVKYNYTVNFAGKGDRSEYDIKSYIEQL